MKLKFLRAVAAGRGHFAAGSTHEIKDRHQAEVYVAHGYAVAADGETSDGATLKRSYPQSAAKAPVADQAAVAGKK